MSFKTLIFGLAAAASVALPGAASAQYYGGDGYGYGQPRYGYGYDRYDRHARQRWEQRRRWEERERRREWQRSRHFHGRYGDRYDGRDYYRY